MFDQLRSRVTYANVMSTLAVFGVLAGGGAYAASKVGPKDIKKDAVRAKHIKDDGVKFRDLKSVKGWKRNVPVSATAADPGDSRAAAKQVVLARRGSLTIYGKCHRSTTNNWVHADMYARTAKNGALTARLAEWQQVVRVDKAGPHVALGAALADADTFRFTNPRFDRWLLLSGDGRLALNVVARSVAKNGTPSEGNAPLGAGNRCLFAGHVIG